MRFTRRDVTSIVEGRKGEEVKTTKDREGKDEEGDGSIGFFGGKRGKWEEKVFPGFSKGRISVILVKCSNP